MNQTDTNAPVPESAEFDLNDQQADAIRAGLTEIVEAGRLMGANEEESE